MGNPPEWRDANRRHWDARVPIHLAGDFYDVASFRAGGVVLRPFELEDVGDVAGRELVHLQCHFGQDTLSWARLGAKVTGLDFSAPAIEAARTLAAEIGVAARFEVGDVYDAPGILGQQYDLVYTGLGALCWLPDLARWADVVASLVRPGGIVYLAEFHPITDTLADEDLVVTRPYFDGGVPAVWDEPGTYADPDAGTAHNLCYEWVHPVSAVVDSLLQRGLLLERFREHDYTLFRRWPFLVQEGRDIYRMPADRPNLPLMYSVRFRRPD